MVRLTGVGINNGILLEVGCYTKLTVIGIWEQCFIILVAEFQIVSVRIVIYILSVAG
jgi:hypothetical protein